MQHIQLSPDGSPLDLPDARLRYFENFFETSEAAHYYTQLYNKIPWQQDPITVFGKTYDQPRLTALHANNANTYTYSGVRMHPHKMTAELTQISNRIARVTPVKFTSVLLNLYRDGKDSNGWHADNEKELGQSPVIASVSFGAPRFFHLKHRSIQDARLKILLQSGSLLLMEGDTQEKWLHQIPKTAKPIAPRINLTFRKII
ncbi:alpha-ketoglutarate-dependent dioxygenase AlkB [Flavobacteriaceae bacterium]|nr:alpha-ketoglutarate-dependent dioxygenase AlkB [Flavobacteriaceae bacterium]MDA9016090.1 alpha-ketoglutarate-dependent dioxygenase AlkB [Flavobacteriaceae bacterium]MDA9572347.1 alpha-ketoglutarate-dependent dioxygenase AlkB [Flavobacteriaceae bacterium]MDB3862575.1 alpha-ketoglutarate-dependent dioxygenase AlkB [Flavobacteriaceae bacterium]